jgi:hypothetical protein
MIQGKIERYHRVMKSVIRLDHHYSPERLPQVDKTMATCECRVSNRRLELALCESELFDDIYTIPG